MFAIMIPLLLGFWGWAVMDIIATEGVIMRHMPKASWLCAVLWLPIIGAVAWILIGRPDGASLALGGERRGKPHRPAFSQRRAERRPEDDLGWSVYTTTSRPDHDASTPDTAVADVPTFDIMNSPAVIERRHLEAEAEAAKQVSGEDDRGTDLDDTHT